MTIKIKGHEIEEPKIVNSFGRRAVQMQNHIIATLKKLGLSSDHIDIEMIKFTTMKKPASAEWYFQGRNFKYTYGQMPRFVDNIYVIDKILEIEVEKFLNKEITLDEFAREFSEEYDHSDQLTEARKTLGVDPEEKDFDVINKSYKKLARTHHPDMAGGDHEMFQKINAAHKLIQKELN
ncbi:MAG: J domain-containing protein [Nanoarchaeota archaeon]|jgi:DnaJ-domain-containing protein 1|nr:J domain-containing protein [Nanoarchaeota archaeon]